MKTNIPEAIGADLQGFGGFLACTVCGHRQPLGQVGDKLSRGWPRCCDLTMRWWTQSQVDNGEAPRRRAS